jgi:photosystem II stability/assembly factor-like uncharacterized protein
MSRRVLVATRKGLFTLAKKQNGAWHAETIDFLADNVSMVLFDRRDGMLYAALDHGHFGAKLHRCQESQRSWTEIAAPAYPEKPADCTDADMWGKPLPWSLIRIWGLEIGGPAEAGRLWCGTIPGGLFSSGDSGDSWELVRGLWDHPLRPKWMGGGADLPGLHSVCVDPRNPKVIRCGVSTGGVWQTEDGGKTWDIRGKGMWALYFPPELANEPLSQDVHRIVQCQSAPDVLWIQHHNGIFKSTDGALTWTEVKNNPVSSFGFGVAVHPRDPKTAWFVPGISDQKRIPVDGKFVVTRTRDGGETFEVLRKGLPDHPAYDLVYRHGFEVSADGDALVIGSTTGHVWISEDQGDSWQIAATHLPPVYCTRFIN